MTPYLLAKSVRQYPRPRYGKPIHGHTQEFHKLNIFLEFVVRAIGYIPIGVVEHAFWMRMSVVVPDIFTFT